MWLSFRLLIAAAALALAGCGSVTRWLDSYTIDIQQGNYVSQDMVSQLKRGMSKEQVRFVLGTPLLTDVFHADRWDYVYYHKVPGGKTEQRKLAVFFKDGRLARLEGDVVPAKEREKLGEAGK
ncbi:MAG: outer membrane protein assembly factor BamE [Burkholderiales bacterium]